MAMFHWRRRGQAGPGGRGGGTWRQTNSVTKDLQQRAEMMTTTTNTIIDSPNKDGEWGGGGKEKRIEETLAATEEEKGRKGCRGDGGWKEGRKEGRRA